MMSAIAGPSCTTAFSIRSRSSTVICTRRAARCCTCCAALSARRAFGGRSNVTCSTMPAGTSRRSTSFARSSMRPAATCARSSSSGSTAPDIRSSKSRIAGTASARTPSSTCVRSRRSTTRIRRSASIWPSASCPRAIFRKRSCATRATPSSAARGACASRSLARASRSRFPSTSSRVSFASTRGPTYLRRSSTSSGPTCTRRSCDASRMSWRACVPLPRSTWAKDALLAAVSHRHPKARRGIAAALGSFQRDEAVADALIGLLRDESYFVVATALEALGKTRDPRAYETLLAHLAMPSWRDTIADGAARGLGELGDERAVRPLIDAAKDDRSEDLRRAALGALARLYGLLDERKPSIVQAVSDALDADLVPVRLAAVGAAEALGQGALIPALRRVAARDGDGRLRRDALEAIERIGEAQRSPAEIAKLRNEIAELREEVANLRARLESEFPAKT